jgi:hypothetical protein
VLSVLLHTAQPPCSSASSVASPSLSSLLGACIIRGGLGVETARNRQNRVHLVRLNAAYGKHGNLASRSRLSPLDSSGKKPHPADQADSSGSSGTQFLTLRYAK